MLDSNQQEILNLSCAALSFIVNSFGMMDGVLFFDGIEKAVLELSANMQEQRTIKAVSACIGTKRPASASQWLLLSQLFPPYHSFYSSLQFSPEAT